MSFVAPNWKNESEYPSHKNQDDLSFWAWQFLRRNKEYQADWHSYVNGLQAMAVRLPELKDFIRLYIDEKFSQSDEGKASKRDGGFFCLLLLASKQKEFSCLPSENQFEQHEIPSPSGGIWCGPRKHALGRKWGINEIVSPGNECLSRSNGFLIDGAGARILGDRNIYSDDNNYIVPVFDVRLPVEALRAQFELFLYERKQRIDAELVTPYKGRPHRALANYRDYLRVLDAIDCAVKLPDIAITMLPKQEKTSANKMVKNWLNAANGIVDDTYRLMPAYSEFKLSKKGK